MPDTGTACGLPPPSLLIIREAVRLPTAAGVKVTLTVQLAPAAKLLPQVLLLWEKSPASAPMKVICQRLTTVLPSLLITTGIAGWT